MWNTTSNFPAPIYNLVDPAAPAYDQPLHLALQQLAADYTMNGPADFAEIRMLGEPWQFVLYDSPNNALFDLPKFAGVMSSWPSNLGQRAIDYIDEIGEFFATDPDGRAAFGSYDIFNEPDCCGPSYDAMLELMRETHQRLSLWHSTAGAPRYEMTVGFADFTATLANHLYLTSPGHQADLPVVSLLPVGSRVRHGRAAERGLGQPDVDARRLLRVPRPEPARSARHAGDPHRQPHVEQPRGQTSGPTSRPTSSSRIPSAVRARSASTGS